MAVMTETLEAGGSSIEIQVRKIRSGARPQFENLFGSYAIGGQGLSGLNLPLGTIKNLALSKGIKSLYVDGKMVKLDRNDPASSLDNIDDDVLDSLEDAEIDLYTELLKMVVKHSPFLGREAPFELVFAQYLPETLEEEDPTTASSSSGSDSDSDTPEN